MVAAVTLSAFIDRFRYKADKRDTWRIIDKAPYQGDCDDFALTAAYIASGGLFRMWVNIWTFRMRFLYVTSDAGESHMVLRYRGKYIDNIKRADGWRDTIGYNRRFPWIALPPVIVIKMLLGKLFG